MKGPKTHIQKKNKNRNMVSHLSAHSHKTELDTYTQKNQSAAGAGGLGIIRGNTVGEAE